MRWPWKYPRGVTQTDRSHTGHSWVAIFHSLLALRPDPAQRFGLTFMTRPVGLIQTGTVFSGLLLRVASFNRFDNFRASSPRMIGVGSGSLIPSPSYQ